MKDALEMNMGGIKCDNPNCDFNDMNVNAEDYKEWLNKPCPKCGENLLTEEDYRNTKFLLEMVKVANRIYPKRKDDEEIVTMSVAMNGDGEMDFNIEK
ncbi:hypothetical protein H7E67_01270 [Clostridium gasigenes]|uniref:hypothetical protein n=1 Tax=Clostridium gasigenes TaxID=94869 RepID=UPI00162939B1|nr:hypothetical protein [Clostridium gasigenes]MBB6622049.1 hypothetical protein [Clostridium gasigenes]